MILQHYIARVTYMSYKNVINKSHHLLLFLHIFMNIVRLGNFYVKFWLMFERNLSIGKLISE